MNKKLVLLLLFLLLSFTASATLFLLKNLRENTQEAEGTTNVAYETETTKVYRSDKYNVTFKYPASWLGPEIYDFDAGIRLEIGTDIVYPYGTGPEERKPTKVNNYYIVVQYNQRPEDFNQDEFDETSYAVTQYNALSGLEIGESITSNRAITTKIRNIDVNGLKGVEYVSTLSDNAQTELFYMREAVLFNGNYDTMIVRGSPDNVTITDTLNWRESFEKIDKANATFFDALVDSIQM